MRITCIRRVHHVHNVFAGVSACSPGCLYFLHIYEICAVKMNWGKCCICNQLYTTRVHFNNSFNHFTFPHFTVVYKKMKSLYVLKIIKTVKRITMLYYQIAYQNIISVELHALLHTNPIHYRENERNFDGKYSGSHSYTGMCFLPITQKLSSLHQWNLTRTQNIKHPNVWYAS